MLGKLLKYEWRGLRMPFIILLIVLASTTVLTCSVILTINPKYDETVTWFSTMALMLSIFLYYFGFIGCIIGIVLVVAIRFYKTCYTDQGYLTHTLPVSTKLLLSAKILAAFVTELLMILAIAASVVIIIQVTVHHVISFFPDYSYDEFTRMFMRELSYVFQDFKDELGISFGLYIVYWIIILLVSMFSNIVTIFGCVSLGQLYAKHRVIGAILAYFAQLFIMRILSYFASLPMYSRILTSDYNSDVTFFSLVSPTMTLTLILTILMAVAMYFVNLHMMTKRLNLE
ncbi:MAG: hypothetical protein K2N95_12435 [Lachnospiraceae bacterium]|nr:hypothetical protein [Lachnospiraceae bacterium]